VPDVAHSDGKYGHETLAVKSATARDRLANWAKSARAAIGKSQSLNQNGAGGVARCFYGINCLGLRYYYRGIYMDDLTLIEPAAHQTIGPQPDVQLFEEVAKNLEAVTPALIKQAFERTALILHQYFPKRLKRPGVAKRKIGSMAQTIVYYGDRPKSPVTDILFEFSIVGWLAVIAARKIARYCRQQSAIPPHIHIILSSRDADTVAERTDQQTGIPDYIWGKMRADYLAESITNQHYSTLADLKFRLGRQNLSTTIEVLRIRREAGAREEIYWGQVVKRDGRPVVVVTVSDMVEDGPSENASPRERRNFFNRNIVISRAAL
jgi:hypothetical protein